MSLIDRFAAELDRIGKRAGQALDEGKLRMELMRVRRRMDHAARDLGYVTYRQAKGEQAAPAEVESLTRRIAEAEAEAARLEAQIAKIRGASADAQTKDGPATTEAASPPPSPEESPKN